MPRRPSVITQDAMPLYPSEDEIARAVLGSRARDWPAVAAIDERHGLPKIDPLHGGRYWPAVKRFYDLLNNLEAQQNAPVLGRVRIIDTAPDGKENPDAARQTPVSARRLDRRRLASARS